MQQNPAPLPDWPAIETVLLDMDGTLLDLKFDNHFWLETVPGRFAEVNGLSLVAAKARLVPLFAAKRGTLDWYCLDYWSGELGLDLAGLKRQVREAISWLAGAQAFIDRLRRRGKRLALVTNAHPETLAVKNEQLDFTRHFDAVYSSHPFGAPKESAAFWPQLAEAEGFDAKRTLFVDDSLPVLRAARTYGIEWIYAIRQPDSTRPPINTAEFPAINAVHELLPNEE